MPHPERNHRRPDGERAILNLMRPGERLRLLIDAGDRLAQRDAAESRVIVRLFGFTPWEPDQWTPADKGWWMDCLSSSEGDLPGLVTFLRDENAMPEASPASWAAQPLTLFLSHLYEHRAFVARVQRVLESCGASSFVAHNDIPSGKLWRDELRGGLRSCSALVAFLHAGFRASQWCDQEVGWALGRDVPVIPVRPAGSSEPHNGFMDEVQHVVLKIDDEWFAARKILEALVTDTRTRKSALRSAAEALANSSSYDSSRWAWGLIEPYESEVESDTLRRLEFAARTNNQVSDAVRLPEGTPIPQLIDEMVARVEPQREPPLALVVDEEPPF